MKENLDWTAEKKEDEKYSKSIRVYKTLYKKELTLVIGFTNIEDQEIG